MMDIRTEVRSMRISLALKSLGKKGAQNAARAATRKTVKPALTDIKTGAPKKTGALERAIKITTPTTKKGVVSGRIGNKLEWTDPKTGKKPQYYMWKRESKDHFFREGFKKHEPRYYKDLGDALWTEILKRKQAKA
jgi:hypothetical protein